MVKFTSSKYTLREDQHKLTEKLKKCDVSQFKRVRTFARSRQARVSLVKLDGHPDSAFALKTVHKAKIKSRNSRKNILTEKETLLEAKSDFIVKLYGTFKDKKYLYFLTEHCAGGDLYLYNRGRFPEDAAKFYIACTIEALDCLHSLNIVHNDLKPGNIVLDDKGYAKLIDMGFSQKIIPGQVSYNCQGTINLLPPEITRILLKRPGGFKGRDRAGDLWALGVLLYKFLTGVYPFQADDHGKICINIEKGIDSVDFSEEFFSVEAVDFIKMLCAYDPKKRLGYTGMDEIRKHRWFQSFDWVGLGNREMQPPIIRKAEDVTYFQSVNTEVSSDSDAVEEDESDWDNDF